MFLENYCQVGHVQEVGWLPNKKQIVSGLEINQTSWTYGNISFFPQLWKQIQFDKKIDSCLALLFRFPPSCVIYRSTYHVPSFRIRDIVFLSFLWISLNWRRKKVYVMMVDLFPFRLANKMWRHIGILLSRTIGKLLSWAWKYVSYWVKGLRLYYFNKLLFCT